MAMEPLDKSSSSRRGGPVFSLKNLSRRSRRVASSPSRPMASLSYRRDRARKRQIFLKTYRLASVKSLGFSNWRAPGLKKAVAKLKEVIVSALSSVRFRFFSSCNCQPPIDAYHHPQTVKKIRVLR
ncbi:hypothetical protein SAY87_011661 [Trapa incisa]|uniref:Uncharacterized protein n=1 Tax=Trapa incisa TaxID=236973 RepID=A0AAN7GWN1_9MYRT|nr:hypothetical protein SAY87_011661 [Trapa incisa]